VDVLAVPAVGAGYYEDQAALLAELNREGLTIILVTHDPGLAAGDARRTVRMDYGRIVEEVRHADPGQASELRNESEGQHQYEFAKRDGAWKITRMEVHLNRRREGVP